MGAGRVEGGHKLHPQQEGLITDLSGRFSIGTQTQHP